MRPLNPYWISGFADGEGCFNIDIHLQDTTKWGVQMQPEFTLVQHERDVELLKDCQKNVGCGKVATNRKDSTSTRKHWRVKNLDELNNTLIPFFDKYPLQTQKKVEFERFKKICKLMQQGYHLQSLKNFLEVYDLALTLRIGNENKTETKSEKLNHTIKELRQRLKKNPNLK